VGGPLPRRLPLGHCGRGDHLHQPPILNQGGIGDVGLALISVVVSDIGKEEQLFRAMNLHPKPSVVERHSHGDAPLPRRIRPALR
jgi:hypothetical protein